MIDLRYLFSNSLTRVNLILVSKVNDIPKLPKFPLSPPDVAEYVNQVKQSRNDRLNQMENQKCIYGWLSEPHVLIKRKDNRLSDNFLSVVMYNLSLHFLASCGYGHRKLLGEKLKTILAYNKY